MFAPSADYTFSPYGEIAVQEDGRILLSGVSRLNPAAVLGLVRLNSDGGLDPTFKTEQIPTSVYEVRLQPDGRILILGVFADTAGQSRPGIARLNSDGSLDVDFAPGER